MDKPIALDCPYTGKGEEMSPTNLVEAALGGCVLMSMGVLAMQSNLDISGASADVRIASSEKPPMRFESIDITVALPTDFDRRSRIKLETGANACPIKHSFGPDVAVTMKFIYPDHAASRAADR
jgi:putative redox protein